MLCFTNSVPIVDTKSKSRTLEVATTNLRSYVKIHKLFQKLKIKKKIWRNESNIVISNIVISCSGTDN